MTTPPRVWITRAEPGAARTASRLAALGFEPVVAPLLAIGLVAVSPRDLDLALEDVAALAFTSPNGVDAFAVLASGGRDLPVFAVGDATASAARTAGFSDVRSAGGDLGDLGRLIAEGRAKVNGTILHPRAEQPVGDLGEAVAALCAAPPPVRGLTVYRAVETGEGPPPAFDWALVHSPRGGRALAAVLGAEASARPPFRIAAISPAAAAPLETLKGVSQPAEIRIAARPDDAALLTALGKPPARV